VAPPLRSPPERDALHVRTLGGSCSFAALIGTEGALWVYLLFEAQVGRMSCSFRVLERIMLCAQREPSNACHLLAAT
jgi:hypothetical protein